MKGPKEDAMDQARLREVLSDEEFVKELLSMKSAEQVQDALEDKGITVTTDEIRQVGDLLRKAESGEISQETLEAAASGELSEAELEEVAGGSLTALVLAFVGIVAGGSIFMRLSKEGIW